MTFAEENAAEEGFNRWDNQWGRVSDDGGNCTGVLSSETGKALPAANAQCERRHHPVHLHRHSFELTKIAGVQTAGVTKDVVMVGGYQEVEVDFTADDPGLTLFHCHQQLPHGFWFHDVVRLPLGGTSEAWRDEQSNFAIRPKPCGQLDNHRSFSHGRSDTLDALCPGIANGKNSREVRFEKIRNAMQWPAVLSV
jgi:hypothetical protein